MKHLIKLFAITLTLSLVACSENEQENPNQNTKKETDVISIDGTKYSLTFTENKEGKITLDKGQEETEKTITAFFKENSTASSYYNESDKVLYLFKDSETMVDFMTKNSKKTSKSMITSAPNANIGLELYADANFTNLMNPIDDESIYVQTAVYKYVENVGLVSWSTLTTGSNAIVGTYTSRGFEVPNLANFKQYKYGAGFYNIEDRLSSVKLKVGPQPTGPVLSNFHQVTVVFYEEKNFGGYSFGMTLNTYNSETSQSNLATLRMYKSWINGSKYFNDRISSYIINAN